MHTACLPHPAHPHTQTLTTTLLSFSAQRVCVRLKKLKAGHTHTTNKHTNPALLHDDNNNNNNARRSSATRCCCRCSSPLLRQQRGQGSRRRCDVLNHAIDCQWWQHQHSRQLGCVALPQQRDCFVHRPVRVERERPADGTDARVGRRPDHLAGVAEQRPPGVSVEELWAVFRGE